MPTFTTQMHTLGLLCEVEITYVMEEERKPEITELWILGYYPEGVADRRRDYVSINAKCDLWCLTNEESTSLDEYCLSRQKFLDSEAWDV